MFANLDLAILHFLVHEAHGRPASVEVPRQVVSSPVLRARESQRRDRRYLEHRLAQLIADLLPAFLVALLGDCNGIGEKMAQKLGRGDLNALLVAWAKSAHLDAPYTLASVPALEPFGCVRAVEFFRFVSSHCHGCSPLDISALSNSSSSSEQLSQIQVSIWHTIMVWVPGRSSQQSQLAVMVHPFFVQGSMLRRTAEFPTTARSSTRQSDRCTRPSCTPRSLRTSFRPAL